MIFTSQLRCETEPDRLRPVVVMIKDHKALYDNSGVLTGFRVRFNIFTDTNADGVPDYPGKPISYWDFENIKYADSGQLTIIQNRLTGTGNLMATLRAYCKGIIDSHNVEMGGEEDEATHTDIDTD